MPKDKEKEGSHLLDTIVDAAKTNVEFARQGAASAVTNIADAIAGKTPKRKSRSKRTPTKKAASKARSKSASIAAKRATKSAKTRRNKSE